MNIIYEKDLGLVHKIDIKTFRDLINLQLKDHTCLANLSGSRRTRENFVSIKFLQFDFDNVNISPEYISSLIDCKHYILLTKSDGINGRCFHLFVPLAEEIKKYEYYEYICDQFLETYKLPIKKDEKAKDAVRFFWKHISLSSFKLSKDIKTYYYSKKDLIERIMKERTIVLKNEVSSNNIEYAVKCYCLKHNTSFDLKTDGNRWQSMIALKNILSLMGFEKQEIINYIDSIAIYEIFKNKQFTKEKVHKFIQTH